MRAITLLALLAGLLAACSDSDGGDDSERPNERSGLDQAVEKISDCLSDGGLSATLKDSVPLTVEVPVRGLKVDLTDEHEGQGLDVWVFETPEDAAANRVAITLSREDTPSSGVLQNKVYRWYRLPDSRAPDTDTAMACIEG